MDKQQKLIDITFEVGMMIWESNQAKYMTREQVCEWIAKQLRECGFDTKPCGMSWGVLK